MTLGGQPTSREPVIPSDIITEWKTYRQLTKWWIPSSQTYRLSQESVSHRSIDCIVERSFLLMKLIKSRLRSCLNNRNLSNLMNSAIESPDKLIDSHLEQIYTIKTKKRDTTS